MMVVFPTPKLIQMFVPRAHERASAQIGYFNAALEGWVRFPTQQIFEETIVEVVAEAISSFPYDYNTI